MNDSFESVATFRNLYDVYAERSLVSHNIHKIKVNLHRVSQN